jgi:hypothetical protein
MLSCACSFGVLLIYSYHWISWLSQPLDSESIAAAAARRLGREMVRAAATNALNALNETATSP